MSATGYLIWFILTAVAIVVVMGLGVAGSAGYFDPKQRAARAALREERRRLRRRSTVR